MLEITRENITKATERAKQNKMLVKFLQFRRYSVTNRTNGNTYEVRFTKIGNRKMADCSCPATVICKHIASCLPHHLVKASEMTQTA